MNIKNSVIKKLLCTILAFTLIVFAQIGLLFVFQKTNNKVSAYYDVSNKVSNSNFDADKNMTTYPVSPSNFTAYSYQTEVSSLSNVTQNVKAGVIDLSKDEFVNKFTNVSKDSLHDQYVLMIEAQAQTSYGYRTNKPISLSANKNYMISAQVYTETNANIAAMYLFNEDGSVFSSIENINSYVNWNTCSFFVSTNENEDLSLTLGLYLNDAGTVLFDSINVYELSNNEVISRKAEAYKSSYTDKRNNAIDEFAIVDSKLQNASGTKQFSLTATEFEMLSNAEEYTSASMDADNDGTNNYAFLIENKKQTYSKYSTPDNFLSFDQNSVYQVSVMAKVTNISGSANLKLVQTNLEDNETATDSSVISISSSTVSSSNVNNNYESFSFFIRTNPFKSTTYKLVFGLGDQDSKATGKFYLSSVKVTKVAYSAYNSSTDSKSTKFSLVGDYAYENSSIRLDNGEFNAIEVSNENIYPAAATNWSVTAGKNQQYYGVVNTSATEWNKIDASKFSNLVNPSKTAANNNIYMLYNESKDTLSVTSKTKTLDAKSYHKFTISVSTQNADAKISLVTTKDEKEIELASTNITTDIQSWKDVNFWLYTGNQKLDVALKIELNSNSYGYVYVDDARFDYLIAPTENQYKSQNNSNENRVVDLTNLFTSTENGQFANANLFSYEENENVVAGIVDTSVGTSVLIQDIMTSNEYAVEFAGINEKNVFAIRATADSNYVATSNIGFDLSADKNYKINVSVFTQQIGSNNTDADASKLGAYLKLTNFDEAFTAIQSNGVWTTYSFYIKPNKAVTTYLQFGLGTTDNQTKGDAFFGKIEFEEEIENDVFNAATETATTKVLKQTSQSDDDQSDDKDTDSKTNTSNINWWYAVPSIVFAVAIVIAVVGVLLRKIKWKKSVKKSKNTYDRNTTVSKQYYERKATIERENKLRELNAELEKLNADRTNFEEQYKQDLNTLRELKIKRANPADIAKSEKDLKKNQKLSANIGVCISKVENEIEYVKSDAYLKAMIKKLSHSKEEVENK